MSGALLVAGTASEVGKSAIVAGLCRLLYRKGIKVAPFKAQNMALNSVVTPDGGEIGRAQAAQAHAAGLQPETAMNPILLKPTDEGRSQVIVMGKPYGYTDARSFRSLKKSLLSVVLDAFEDLRSRFDVVVCEGAGSPAEINLRESDLANMELARRAGIPVVVVGDIDRGGVLASFYGTLALLAPADQALVSGFIVNKFRGDAALLQPGLERIEALTARPILGVLPWAEDLWMDGEDSLVLDSAPQKAPSRPKEDTLAVAVVRLPRISNFTDFDPLVLEPGVEVRFTRSRIDIERADLVVLPGTKATVEDLGWLRSCGLDRALIERARRGRPILGICGGYQMLGLRISDRIESGAGEVRGLSLLPVETVFAEEKVLRRRRGRALGFGDSEVGGYEIRHGRLRTLGGEPLFSVCDHPEGADASEKTEGCRAGPVLGTSWHGIFEHDGFRRSFLSWVAIQAGVDWAPGEQSFAGLRRQRADRLADLVEAHTDTSALMRLIEDGAPADLPVISPGGPA